ncbi:hypothetical protein ACFL4L_03415 [bacterium]
MEISIEELIVRVTHEVIRELKTHNITVIFDTPIRNTISGQHTKSETIDMSKYKTPILTENHIQRLHELTGEIIIPKGTIITPKARELIRERQLEITIH